MEEQPVRQSPAASATQSPASEMGQEEESQWEGQDRQEEGESTLPASVDQVLDLHTAVQTLASMREQVRIVPLQDAIERNIRVMNLDELRGALYVLAPLSAYLLGQCVEGREPAFNKTSLVKTLEELLEIALEVDIHNGYATGGESE
jgi:hypothetical protein